MNKRGLLKTSRHLFQAFLATAMLVSSCGPKPSAVPIVDPTTSAREPLESISLGANNGLAVSIGGQETSIVINPIEGGDVSRFSVSEVDLGTSTMVVITDPDGFYLPEVLFLSDDSPEQIRVFPQMKKIGGQETPNSTLKTVHNIGVEPLMKEPIGETSFEELQEFLTQHFQESDFGLLIGVSENLNKETRMIVFRTPQSGLYLAIPKESIGTLSPGGYKLAAPARNFIFTTLVVLVIAATVGFQALPFYREYEKLTAEYPVADFKGMTPEEFNEMHELKFALDYGATGGPAFGTLFKTLTKEQYEAIPKYMDQITIIDVRCGSPEYLGRFFAQDPPPGTKIVPMDDEVFLYHCVLMSDEEARVVTVSFVGDPDICPAETAQPSLDVVLVIDVSGSMTGSRIAAAKASSIEFVKHLDPETDRVGLVTFNSRASTMSPLTGALDLIITSIGNLEAGGGTAIDAGLRVGDDVLDSSVRAGVLQIILLLSDGQSDPEAALEAASQIKSDNVQLMTVGVGQGTDQGLLHSIASTPNDFLFSRTNQGIRELFSETLLRVTTGHVVAHDVTIKVEVDAKEYGVVDSMLTHDPIFSFFSSFRNPRSIIEWQIPSVYAGQTISRPLVVRPHGASSATIGTAEISYGKCEDGERVTLDPLTVEGTSSRPDDSFYETLTVGSATSGSFGAFDSQGWAMDVTEPGLYSVVVEGAGSRLLPEIFTGDGSTSIHPLYSLLVGGEETSVVPRQGGRLMKPFLNTGMRRINVYFIENPKVHWLYLQSNGPDDSGQFTMTLVNDAVDDPQILQLDSAQVTGVGVDGQSQVYALAGVSEGDAITIHTTPLQESAFVRGRIVSLGGEPPGYMSYIQDSGDNPTVLAGKLRGNGPYRLVVDTFGSDDPVKFTLRLAGGDEFTVNKGQIHFGENTEDVLQPQHVDMWEFEGAAGDGATIITQILQEEVDLRLTLVDPDEKVISGATNEDQQIQKGPIVLPVDGTYSIYIEFRNYSEDAVTYELSLESSEIPEPVFGTIRFGETVSGTLIEGEGREDNWSFEAQSGQSATLLSSSSSSQFAPHLILLDPKGNTVAESVSYSGEAQIGPLEIADSGMHTIVVSGAFYGGPYELTLRAQSGPELATSVPPTASPKPADSATPAATPVSSLIETEAAVIRYWALVTERKYEQAWQVLSWSFRDRNFNHDIDRYIDELATIDSVDVLSAYESASSGGFAEVVGDLEIVSTSGVVQAQSMTFGMIYDQSTDTWHIDWARID